MYEFMVKMGFICAAVIITPYIADKFMHPLWMSGHNWRNGILLGL